MAEQFRGIQHAARWAKDRAKEFYADYEMSEEDRRFFESNVAAHLSEIFKPAKTIAENYSTIPIKNIGESFWLSRNHDACIFEFAFIPTEEKKSLLDRIKENLRKLLKSPSSTTQSATAIDAFIARVTFNINLDQNHQISQIEVELAGVVTLLDSLKNTIIWEIIHEEDYELTDEVEQQLDDALNNIDYIQNLKYDGYSVSDASGAGEIPSTRSIFLLYDKEHEPQLAQRLQGTIDKIFA